ncbi:MAG TPA: hypothetical protein VMY42_15380 [Thermoguttaceae bacterium]|nr:hypothetical protein [Thermoguttaceae bacterium]
MKRLLVLSVAVGFLAVLALSQSALGGQPADKPPEKPAKVLICHVQERMVEVDEETGEETEVVTRAHVIEVSENAVEAHLAHGDLLAPDREKCSDCTDMFAPAPVEEGN